MPLYEYECSTCNDTVEILVASPDATPACPDCENGELTRLISATASPNMKGSLPVSRPEAQACDAPRCCGGGCDL